MSDHDILSVRTVEEDPNLVLAFGFRGKKHQLQRPKHESLAKTLARINLNLNKQDKKIPSGAEDIPIEAHLVDIKTGSAVPGHVTNLDAWCSGRGLSVGCRLYAIHVNPPRVTSIKMPRSVYVDHPVVPQVELDFADLSRCCWRWERLETSDPRSDRSGNEVSSSSSSPGAVLRGNSFVYWPTSEDEGYMLMVECTPRDERGAPGEPARAPAGPVQRMRLSAATLRRHAETVAPLPPRHFRVVSYNILADIYASSNHALEKLFPYCGKEALSAEYRQCKIVHELLGYHADVICLQEVGVAMYKQFIQPALAQAGYEGCLHLKVGSIPEGEALFYNTLKFSMLWSDFASLSKFLQTDPSCSDLLLVLQQSPEVITQVTTKHTIVQLVALRCLDNPNHILCVANTHLYFHPSGDHIRLLQTEVALRYLHKAISDKMALVSGGASPLSCNDVALVFAGDFNSCPCTAAFQLMVEGHVPADHVDWTKHSLPSSLYPKCVCGCVSVRSTAVEGGEEGNGDTCTQDLSERYLDGFQGVSLEHHFYLQSACGIPLFTNYTATFRATLDYIFVDIDHLQVISSVSLPSEEEVAEFVALPSVYFPSDHVALVCTLCWKSH